jgi:hypothetical protein
MSDWGQKRTLLRCEIVPLILAGGLASPGPLPCPSFLGEAYGRATVSTNKGVVPMKTVSLLILLAMSAPAFAAISEPSAPSVEPAKGTKRAPLIHYDSRRIMIRPGQDDRLLPQRLGPTTTDPKDKAGPEIR